MEIKKEDFDSGTLEDIHRILEALNKCDDETIKKILGDVFNE